MPGHVLVTVGSTKFDQLIRAVDTEAFADALHERGYASLLVQVQCSTWSSHKHGCMWPGLLLRIGGIGAAVHVCTSSLLQPAAQGLENACRGATGSTSHTCCCTRTRAQAGCPAV